MAEAIKALGLMVGIVVALTLLGGGKFSLGTSSSGPYAGFSFAGPYQR